MSSTPVTLGSVKAKVAAWEKSVLRDAILILLKDAIARLGSGYTL